MNGKRLQGPAGWLLILMLGLSSGLYAAPAAAPPPSPSGGKLSDALLEMKDLAVDVTAEVEASKRRALEVQAFADHLLKLNEEAGSKISGLETLVEDHAARVQQLGDRYTKVLTLAQKMKHDLEFSTTLNYVLGGTTVVAVLVAVGVAFAHGK